MHIYVIKVFLYYFCVIKTQFVGVNVALSRHKLSIKICDTFGIIVVLFPLNFLF